MNMREIAAQAGPFQARNSSEKSRLDQSLANLLDPGILVAEQGWVDFVERARNLIFQVAQLRGITATEAADVFQEVMLAVVRRIGKTSCENEQASVEAWVRRIASNKTADIFRGRERAERLDVRAVDWNQPADEEREELEWRREVLSIALRNVQERVSPQDFKIFEMALFEGLRASEIARSLHKSVEAVYSAIKRMRKEVRDEIRHLQEIGY